MILKIGKDGVGGITISQITWDENGDKTLCGVGEFKPAETDKIGALIVYLLKQNKQEVNDGT